VVYVFPFNIRKFCILSKERVSYFHNTSDYFPKQQKPFFSEIATEFLRTSYLDELRLQMMNSVTFMAKKRRLRMREIVNTTLY
jgi:hypothetical protein